MHVNLAPNGPNIVQASFSAATTGDIVAAVTGKVIRVYGVNVQSAGAVTMLLKQGSTGLEPARSLITGTPVEIKHPVPGRPAFETAAGAAFGVTLGGSVQVSGSVWYSVGDA